MFRSSVAALLSVLAMASVFCPRAEASRPIPAKEQTIYSSDKSHYLFLKPKDALELHGVCRGEATAFDAGSKTKLWSVPIFCTGAQIGNDGKKMVVVYPPGEEEQTALAFYLNGKLIKEYKIKDFPSQTAAHRIISSGRCWRCDDGDAKTEFSGDQSKFTIVMDDKSTAVFDTASGAMISRTGPKR